MIPQSWFNVKEGGRRVAKPTWKNIFIGQSVHTVLVPPVEGRNRIEYGASKISQHEQILKHSK